ncbi:MAG: PAS domain S-box protein [bacterium]|nr:PAS domain S-box protein [bacterium]
MPQDTLTGRPVRIQRGSLLAEPMQAALSGKSGVMRGLDYNGDRVIAAYQPVKGTNFGVVAKVCISDANSYVLHGNQWRIVLMGAIALIGILSIARVTRRLVIQLGRRNNDMQTEIERRTRLEEDLRYSSERFRDLIETISEIAYEIDCDGSIEYVSPVVTKVLGYKVSDLIGNDFVSYIHSDDREVVMRSFESSLNGQSVTTDFRAYRLMEQFDGCVQQVVGS